MSQRPPLDTPDTATASDSEQLDAKRASTPPSGKLKSDPPADADDLDDESAVAAGEPDEPDDEEDIEDDETLEKGRADLPGADSALGGAAAKSAGEVEAESAEEEKPAKGKGKGPYRVKDRSIELTVFGRTDVGQIREHNEDNFLIADLSSKVRGIAGTSAKTVRLGAGGMLLAVCDGMGGAAAGEVASKLATDIVYDKMLGAAGHKDRDQLALDIVDALEEAGSRILEESNTNRACRGMGTTATVAALVDDCLLLGQVGDSRAYILRAGRLVQVTRDQSLVNQLIEAGQLTEEEAENFEHSNIILQALGTADAVQVDLTYAHLCRGDILMMCSDGLSGMIRDNDIRETLSNVTDPVEACRILIDDANQAGGHDNITVIVAVFDGDSLHEPKEDEIASLKYAKYTVPSWSDDSENQTQPVRGMRAGYDDTPTIEIIGEFEVDLSTNWEDQLFEDRPKAPAAEDSGVTNIVIWVAVAVLVFALYYLIAR
jgi:PPM family protein phosphatase